MNKTVTIESRTHKYQNTYGGNVCASDFCMKEQEILLIELHRIGNLMNSVNEISFQETGNSKYIFYHKSVILSQVKCK